MFGLLKKIFKRDEEDSSDISPVPAAGPAFSRTATPSQPGRSANPFTPGESRPAATAPTVPPVNLASTAAVKTPSSTGGSLPDAVSLPLSTVIAGLAPEFQNLFAPGAQANTDVPFSLQAILPQLSSGRVRVAFGELRKACPNGIYKGGAEHDAKLIDLPLANILSRINPALLPRKTQRQLMDVPKDVTGLFGGLADPVAGSTPAPAAPAAPVRPAPPAPKEPEVSKPIAMTKPPAAAPAVPPAAAAPARRKSAIPDDLESIPSIFSMPKSAPVNESAPVAEVPAPVEAPAPEPEAEPVEMPKIKFSLGAAAAAPVRPATPASQAVPATPKAAAPAAAPQVVRLPDVNDENYITVAIRDVMEGWPQPVLDEIRQYHLEASQLSLPSGEVDMAMRKGKIVFKWKVLRGWIAPAGGAPSATAADDLDVALPLKTIAPLFLARRQPKGKQRKAFVEESIPDLFSGGPEGAAPAPVAAPAAPAPAAPVAAAPKPAEPAVSELAPVATPARKPVGINAANPKELVDRTPTLKGVSGALLAMSDGLVVASALPAPLHGETVSAFLPQIFGRLTQFSTELKLGDLSSVMLVMDNTPWIIFRTGKIYFAVVGKQGEALPLPQLTAIVADIKRQNL